MSDQLQMFEENNYQKSMLSPLEALAKTLAWQESVGGWMAKDQALSLKPLGSSMNADQEFLSGKMLKEHSPQTMAKTFAAILKAFTDIGGYRLEWQLL